MKVRILLYSLFLTLLYLLAYIITPLRFNGVSPSYLLCAVVALGLFENEYFGAIYGLVFGLISDLVGSGVFGFNALFCMLLCVGAGLVFIYVLRRSVLNVMLISLFAIFTRSLLEFFFTFVIYDYQGLPQFFYTVIAPQAVWTAVFSLPLCLLFRYLHSRFEPEETRE